LIHSSTGDLPSIPISILGPSTASFEPGCVSTEDGVTVKSDTWLCSMTTGARYAKSTRNKDVSIKTGVRYKVVAFEMSASIAVMRFTRSDKRESCSKIQVRVNQYRRVQGIKWVFHRKRWSFYEDASDAVAELGLLVRCQLF
jgi:hypothetical protein